MLDVFRRELPSWGSRPAAPGLLIAWKVPGVQNSSLFCQQELEMYDTCKRRIAECDEQLQDHLASFADTVPPPGKEDLPPKKKRSKTRINPTSISPMNYSASLEWI